MLRRSHARLLAALALAGALALTATGVGTTVDDARRQTAAPSSGPLWHDVTAAAIGKTASWTNKVEIADLNGDGRPDLLFANGGDYSTPGTPELNQVFFNLGPGFRFAEMTREVFGGTPTSPGSSRRAI